MKAYLALVYGLITYLLFLATFLYLIGFVGNVVVPKSIDSGTPASLGEALLVNTLLLGVFGLQHSVMARKGFKRWWTRIVPEAVERSTFVLFTNLALLLLFWQWRPLPARVWVVEGPIAAQALQASFGAGWALVLISTYLLDHFELFGLRQVFARLQNRVTPAPVFKAPSLYRYVRHPIYLGLLLAFWSTPTMSVGHLLFAAGMTGYILIGIRLEERDLLAVFGEQYRRYREQVAMLFPLQRVRRNASNTEARTARSSQVPTK